MHADSNFFIHDFTWISSSFHNIHQSVLYFSELMDPVDSFSFMLPGRSHFSFPFMTRIVPRPNFLYNRLSGWRYGKYCYELLNTSIPGWSVGWRSDLVWCRVVCHVLAWSPWWFLWVSICLRLLRYEVLVSTVVSKLNTEAKDPVLIEYSLVFNNENIGTNKLINNTDWILTIIPAWQYCSISTNKNSVSDLFCISLSHHFALCT